MKKIDKKYNLQIGDTVEVGLDEYGEILDLETNAWNSTITAKVVGSSLGLPIIYVDNKSWKKHSKTLDLGSMTYSESNIDDSQKDNVVMSEERFYTITKTWNYNKLGDPRPKNPIEEKWGVKIGEKIKVALTKSNKACKATGSKTGKFAEGRVVGGDSTLLYIHFDTNKVNIDNLQEGDDYYIHSSIKEDNKIEEALNDSRFAFHFISSKKAFEKIESSEKEELVDEHKALDVVEPLPMTEERSSYVAKLGDKVLVERDQHGRLIDNKATIPDTTGTYPPVLCTVVGTRSFATIMVDKTIDNCGAPIDTYLDYIDSSYIDQADKNKKYWNLHSYKPTPISLWGLQVGDEIVVGKDYSKHLITDEASFWSGKGVKGKVIGFEFNSKGEPTAPLIYLDPASLKKSKIKTKQAYDPDIHKDDIAFRFLNDSSINKEKGCFWYLHSQKAFTKVEKVEKDNGVKMSNVQSNRPAFWNMMKDDGESALYRIAATQSTKGVKAAILAMMAKQGSDSSKLKALEEILETEFGDALVSAILGMGLTYLPKVSEDPRVSKLASELRVNSMGTVGNAVMEMALEHFIPVILTAVNSIPAEEQQVRVGENKQEEEQEEEKQVEGKRAAV